MGSPISPMDVINIINMAMDLHAKLKDQPDQMVKIGKRMPRLKDYLEELDDLIDTKKHPGSLASLRPKQTKRLGQLMKDVKTDVQEVLTLLKRWETNQGPAGLVWRFDWVAHIVYTLGSSPDKLDALYESIELHLNDINRFVTLLSAFAQNEALKPGNAKVTVANKDKNKKADKDKPVKNGKQVDKDKKPLPQQKQRPSPSPEPPLGKRRADYKICFVDGFNKGRGRVAEAYLKLLRAWTLESKQEWRVLNIHSVGFSVRRADGCDKEVKALTDNMVDGGDFLNYVAMDSLFDNKLFSRSYKLAVRTYVQSFKTIGLPKDLFSRYDYVVAFTLAQQVKLYKLREALAKVDQGSRTHGKGKIVLLGEYRKPGLQIFEPEPETDREKWNKTTGSIKLACKAFLKKEFGWKQPASTS